MAVPFLLAALGIGRVAEWMRNHRRILRGVTVATGVIMVLVGVLLFTGSLELLARYGFFVDLGL
jgi:cytochrome c-type biogenesis protein